VELWGKLLEAVGRVSQFTRSYLLEANPVSFEKGVLIIGFDPEFADHIGLVDNPRNHALLQTKLLELGYPNSQLKFIQAEVSIQPSLTPPSASSLQAAQARTSPGPARAAPSATPKEHLARAHVDKESFKNDPLIQKALEIFKGQIVEVRA
jgi:hypothetical protein